MRALRSDCPKEGDEAAVMLHLIKTAQAQHGGRYGDYQRYRRYCSARLRRLFRSLRFLHGKGKYQRKSLEPNTVTDVRHLHIPLFSAERAWAYAMELKQAISEAGSAAAAQAAFARKRAHLLRRLARAARWADGFSRLCAARADSKTALEAEAYASYMWGTVLMERETDFDAALQKFSRARTVYEQLGRVGDVEEQMECRQRAEEMEPSIRFCRYKMGAHAPNSDSSAAASNLLDLSAHEGPGADLLQSKLEAVMEEARSREAANLAELDWLGRKYSVLNAKTRVCILKAQQLEAEVASADVANDRRLNLYDKIFVAYHDAKRLIRDDMDAERICTSDRSREGSPQPAIRGIWQEASTEWMTTWTWTRQALTATRKIPLLRGEAGGALAPTETIPLLRGEAGGALASTETIPLLRGEAGGALAPTETIPLLRGEARGALAPTETIPLLRGEAGGALAPTETIPLLRGEAGGALAPTETIPLLRGEAGGALAPMEAIPLLRGEAGGALAPTETIPLLRREAGGALAPTETIPLLRGEAGGALALTETIPLLRGEAGGALAPTETIPLLRGEAGGALAPTEAIPLLRGEAGGALAPTEMIPLLRGEAVGALAPTETIPLLRGEAGGALAPTETIPLLRGEAGGALAPTETIPLLRGEAGGALAPTEAIPLLRGEAGGALAPTEAIPLLRGEDCRGGESNAVLKKEAGGAHRKEEGSGGARRTGEAGEKVCGHQKSRGQQRRSDSERTEGGGTRSGPLQGERSVGKMQRGAGRSVKMPEGGALARWARGGLGVTAKDLREQERLGKD
ncbi:unnamed protein product [Closterium sp. NIES-65]|nr:unnamed protein product [Closterium sp. NIES-65]